MGSAKPARAWKSAAEFAVGSLKMEGVGDSLRKEATGVKRGDNSSRDSLFRDAKLVQEYPVPQVKLGDGSVFEVRLSTRTGIITLVRDGDNNPWCYSLDGDPKTPVFVGGSNDPTCP